MKQCYISSLPKVKVETTRRSEENLEKWTESFNSNFIESCKKPFYLINTARGKIVETAALVQGLESGMVEGACLDVLEYESSSFESTLEGELPVPLEYLLKSNKTLLTPHVAGWTTESYEKLSFFLLEKIRANF